MEQPNYLPKRDLKVHQLPAKQSFKEDLKSTSRGMESASLHKI